MSNELIVEKSWFKKNWKWVLPLFFLFFVVIYLVSSSSWGGLLGDYGKAYADSSLYVIPLKKARDNARVKEVLGEIEPMGKMAIINGAIHYSDDNSAVESTIKIFGEKGKAMLDISAKRIDGEWLYHKINIRIKNPPEKKELIPVIEAID